MSDNQSYFPWHESHWQRLQQCKLSKRLPHALLFVGTSGMGKLILAEQFAQSLLCLQPKKSGLACEECRTCRLFKAGNHPDYKLIEPEQKGKAIKIDQIRNLITSADKTAQQGGYKLVIIRPADAMNINAANALLKTLEEPSDNTLLILVTERLMTLPATIRSRCQMVHFTVPLFNVAEKWLLEQGVPKKQLHLLLKLADGAPLKALKLYEEDELAIRKALFEQWNGFMNGEDNPVNLAKQWVDKDLTSILNYLASWVSDLLRIKQTNDVKTVINDDIASALQTIGAKIDIKHLYSCYDELVKLQHWLAGKMNLNPQLMLEGVLIKLTCNRDRGRKNYAPNGVRSD